MLARRISRANTFMTTHFKRRNRGWRGLLFLLIALTYSQFLLATSAASELPQVHEFILKNGLKLLVKPDKRAPVVVSQLCYRVGSSYEEEGTTGIAHVLEHMMFKGTRRYPAGQFSRIIAENGGHDNASTGYDFTCYFQELAANKLALSFQLEADRMQHLTFDQSEFAKEMEVIKEERRMRIDDKPVAGLYERFMSVAHVRFPYQHSVVGWMSDLRQINLQDVKAWYQKWYTPSNAVLIVVGDVKPEAVLTLARRYFGYIPNRAVPGMKQDIAVPFSSERNIRVELPAQLPSLMLGFNVPSLKTLQSSTTTGNVKSAYALEVLAAFFSEGESGLLNRILIRKQQIASEASAQYDLYTRFPGLFVIEATPSQGHDVSQLRHAIFALLNQVMESGVSDTDLNRVKTQLVAQQLFARDSMFYQALQMGYLESAGLSWRELEQYSQQIQAITSKDLQDVARQYLVSHNMTAAELVPTAVSTTPSTPLQDLKATHEHVS